MDWLVANSSALLELIIQVVGVAALVATITPNDSDNTAVDFILNIVNLLGANVGRSKNA